MMELLPIVNSDKYWLELTQFAWLAQYISGLLGGKSKVYEEMVKNEPSKNRSEGVDNTSSSSSIDEWRKQADERGLKYKS